MLLSFTVHTTTTTTTRSWLQNCILNLTSKLPGDKLNRHKYELKGVYEKVDEAEYKIETIMCFFVMLGCFKQHTLLTSHTYEGGHSLKERTK